MREPLALAVAFLAGAIPFSNLTARLVRGVDLRAVGNGTVSGTGLYRVAGTGPLVLAGILDVAKGTAGPLLLGREHPLAGLAVGLAVAGHNWSPFLRFAGGRGFSVAMGGLAVLAWQGAALLLTGLALGRLLHQTALVGGMAVALLPVVLGAVDGTRGLATGLLLLGVMAAKRLAGNAPARGRDAYLSRLLYDRDTS